MQVLLTLAIALLGALLKWLSSRIFHRFRQPALAVHHTCARPDGKDWHLYFGVRYKQSVDCGRVRAHAVAIKPSENVPWFLFPTKTNGAHAQFGDVLPKSIELEADLGWEKSHLDWIVSGDQLERVAGDGKILVIGVVTSAENVKPCVKIGLLRMNGKRIVGIRWWTHPFHFFLQWRLLRRTRLSALLGPQL